MAENVETLGFTGLLLVVSGGAGLGSAEDDGGGLELCEREKQKVLQ